MTSAEQSLTASEQAITDAADLWAKSGVATRAIHVGSEPEPITGAVIPPLFLTSTFKQDGVGGMRAGYDYSRSGNPTRTSLERALAAVEGGSSGHAFASGLAAEDVLLRSVLRPGDHLVIPDDAYGGTYRLIARVLAPWGVEFTPVDTTSADAVAAAIRPSTRIIWIETPSNPLLGIAPIGRLAALAREADALLVVDNTFATPALQQPLALGAGVVVHSTTKYIGGHSDVVGGALVLADGVALPDDRPGPTETGLLADAVAFLQNSAGAVPGPFDSWLTLRGLKTLTVRMDRHSDNAAAIAEFLDDDARVGSVLYPGLAGDPGHEIAASQMSRFGGMVSVRLGSREKALALCDRTRVFTLAESLGGVESLIEQPAQMTHASVAGSALEVPDDLVRISVGIEDVADLLADLDQALA